MSGNLPPGCTNYDIENAYGGDMPPECEICANPEDCPGMDKCPVFLAAQAIRDKENDLVSEQMYKDFKEITEGM